MRIKDYIGLKINPDRMKGHNYIYLENDYETPVYRIIISDKGYEATERCYYYYYYLDIFVDEKHTVLSIERNKDIFLTNYVIKRMPTFYEKQAEIIMLDITRAC